MRHKSREFEGKFKLYLKSTSSPIGVCAGQDGITNIERKEIRDKCLSELYTTNQQLYEAAYDHAKAQLQQSP